MRVHRIQLSHENDLTFELLDDTGQPIEAVSGFMRHLRARGCSPNTLSAYVYDLLHFLSFLEYLSTLPSRRQAQRLGLALSTTTAEGAASTCLSPATVNRIIAAVSSFYEYLILSGQFTTRENPIHQVDDPALARVSERHRPFMGRVSRQRPIRPPVHVKTAQRLPHPMDDDQLDKLLTSLRLKRDRAMFLLMLHGGLRQEKC